MELQLFRDTAIGNVKRQFAKHFPYLSLEFFSRPCASRTGSLMQKQLSDKVLLAQIKTVWREGVLTFHASMTVAAFESLLQNRFGLSVHVLRRSGELWTETIQTDFLSLETQNNMGAVASKPVRINQATLFL